MAFGAKVTPENCSRLFWFLVRDSETLTGFEPSAKGPGDVYQPQVDTGFGWALTGPWAPWQEGVLGGCETTSTFHGWTRRRSRSSRHGPVNPLRVGDRNRQEGRPW